MFAKYEVKDHSTKTLASECDFFLFSFNSPAVCIYFYFILTDKHLFHCLLVVAMVATCFLDNRVFCLLVAMAMTLTRRTHTLHRSRMYKIETLFQYKLFHLDNLYNLQQFPISFVFNAKSRMQFLCTFERLFFYNLRLMEKIPTRQPEPLLGVLLSFVCSDND